MHRHPCLAGLLACLLGCAFALPAQADVASPERERRKAAVAQWHQKYPGTTPAMQLSLSPDGKTLAVRFEAKTPADYRISLDGSQPVEGKVAELKGSVQTQRIPLAGEAGRKGSLRIAATFRLKGVQGEGTKLRETGDSISGCLLKRFQIVEKDGKFWLNELGLDGGDYFYLRGCRL